MPGRSDRYGRFSVRWAIWMVLAAASLHGLRQYHVDNSLETWLPDRQSSAPVRAYLVIGVEGPESRATGLAERLRRLPSVRWCIDPVAVAHAASLTGVTPENFVIGPGQDYFGLYVFPREGVEDAAFVDTVRAALDDLPDAAKGEIAMGGPAVFHVALNRWSQHRLPMIAILIVVMGAVVTRFVTGRWSVAMAGVGAITMSQVVLLGAISATGRPIDLSLSLVPPLMMALGFSYVIHRALRPAVTGVLVLSALTTAAGFASFLFAGLPPVQAFAAYGIAGLGLVWLAVVMLVPAARSDRRPAARHWWLRRVQGVNLAAAFRHRRQAVAGAVLVSLAGMLGAARLRFETDPLKYFPADAAVVRDFRELNERLTGMLPFEVTVAGDADPTEVLEASPGVRKVINLSFLLGPDSRRVYWCLADDGALPEVIAARGAWGAWASANEVELEVSGVAAQLADIGHVVRRTALLTLPLMTLIAALAGGLLARSIFFGVFSAWINVFPVLLLTLIAALCDIGLNVPSFMIGAIAIGVALDDTVHLAAAVRARDDVVKAWHECWLACLGSSLAAASCLALFALSGFQPTAQFGGLMALAVLAALVGDLVVMPALLAKTLARGHSPGNAPATIAATRNARGGHTRPRVDPGQG